MLWFVEGRNLLKKTSFVEWVPEETAVPVPFTTRPFEGFVSYLQASEWERRVLRLISIMPVAVLFITVLLITVHLLITIYLITVYLHPPPGIFYRLNSELPAWVYAWDFSRANRDIEGHWHYLKYIASLREVVPAGEVNGCALFLRLASKSLHQWVVLPTLFGDECCCSSPRPFYINFYPPLRKEMKWGLSISKPESAVYLKALSALILWVSWCLLIHS